MTFTEAATLVLRLVGKPLHFKEITDVAIEKNLLSHVGKNPEVTMGARLSAQIKKTDRDNPLVRVKPGVFALAEWDEATVEKGLNDRTPALERVQNVQIDPSLLASSSDEEDDEDEAGAAEATAVTPSLPPPADQEEVHRAELSALGTDLFEAEEDDDQPIFGAPAEEAPAVEGDTGGGRESRRRRRRKRGKRGDGETAVASDDGDDDLPAYTVLDAPSDDVIGETEPEASSEEEDDGVEVDLGAVLYKVLGGYDAARGPVSAQALADALRRQPGVDRSVNAAAVLSVAQADALLAERQGRVARFRVHNGKVALSSWSLDRRGVDRLRELERALSPVREGTVRALAEQIGRLPQRAFGDIVTVLLERVGVSRLTPVKRPGAHGAELHLSGRIPHITQPYLPGEDPRGGVTVGINVRRDGKDIGRERVTELRGALHHYGPAAQGWLITSGQVLSGAREEAASAGGSPVILTGRLELAELCVLHGVLVRTHKIEVPLLDLDLLESFAGR